MVCATLLIDPFFFIPLFVDLVTCGCSTLEDINGQMFRSFLVLNSGQVDWKSLACMNSETKCLDRTLVCPYRMNCYDNTDKVGSFWYSMRVSHAE
jgi:hypothetical protein